MTENSAGKGNIICAVFSFIELTFCKKLKRYSNDLLVYSKQTMKRERGKAARTTLIHIEKELRKNNVGAIRLDVYSKNPFALSLYLRCGYTQTGIADWRKGRFYLMEKKLCE